MTIGTKQDMTDRMDQWAQKRVIDLEKENLCGFIFKSDSPSSGMERVKVYKEKGIPTKKGIGMFARIFMDHFPLLPAEDERRLHHPKLRENFVERIFALRRWRGVLAKRESYGNLVNFHAQHELLILSHSTKYYQMMAGLVAQAKNIPLKKLYQQYQTLLMEALQLKSTSKKDANALRHVMRYFRKGLSLDEKKELLEVVENYQRKGIPLIVPITLINHYVRKYNQPYLKQQFFLNPHPLELQLRNHV
jgi:uncharacterized protein YbgA (DUF1722 family)